MTDTNTPSGCELCGSLVIRHHSSHGPSYYIPVSEEAIMALLSKRDDIDMFILDRLQRAERIIEKLRKDLSQARRSD